MVWLGFVVDCITNLVTFAARCSVATMGLGLVIITCISCLVALDTQEQNLTGPPLKTCASEATGVL